MSGLAFLDHVDPFNLQSLVAQIDKVLHDFLTQLCLELVPTAAHKHSLNNIEPKYIPDHDPDPLSLRQLLRNDIDNLKACLIEYLLDHIARKLLHGQLLYLRHERQVNPGTVGVAPVVEGDLDGVVAVGVLGQDYYIGGDFGDEQGFVGWGVEFGEGALYDGEAVRVLGEVGEVGEEDVEEGG